jgi:hypothetical protein
VMAAAEAEATLAMASVCTLRRRSSSRSERGDEAIVPTIASHRRGRGADRVSAVKPTAGRPGCRGVALRFGGLEPAR